jgi:hypothetical protein
MEKKRKRKKKKEMEGRHFRKCFLVGLLQQ